MKRLILLLAAGMMVPAVAALKTTWDVGDYVQDGLIAHYDAIRNAGADQEQDPHATVWKDLSPNAGQATRGRSVYNGKTGLWTSNAYVFEGESYWQMDTALALGQKFTIQIACQMEVDSRKTGRIYPTLFYGSDNWLFQMDRKWEAASGILGTNIYWNTTKYDSGERPTMNWPDGKYINAAFGDTHKYWTPYTDWSIRYLPARAERNEVGALRYIWGGKHNQGEDYGVFGPFHSLRIYSRVLTNEELVWNRAIDEIRFHGAAATPYTNVVVAVSEGGIGVEIPGSYVVDGTHTFTAEASFVSGNTFVPDGYTLEIWDAGSSKWGSPVEYEGDNFVYDASETRDVVRLTWLWKQASGIRRYDVGDYVQEGLIAHYDAIRNAGADQEQDPHATVWKDLSPNAGQATRGRSVYNGKTGLWTSNAYVFEGESYWQMDTALALGQKFTIQIACQMEVDSRKTGRIYPTLFYGSDNWLFQMDRKWEAASGILGTNIYWNTTKYDSGERPTMNWPDGKYINAAFGDTHKYWTPYTDWSIRYLPARAERNEVGALRYIWGGKHNQGEDYGVFGPFHSLRIYSRMLTNEELAYNRDIDEVRFHGAEPTWSNSVYVVSASAEASGAETGAYRLIGEYTFTAPEKVVAGDKKLYAAGSVVETWNAAEKKWENPVYLSGSSRRLTVAESSVARRLTWKWKSMNHLRILVR